MNDENKTRSSASKDIIIISFLAILILILTSAIHPLEILAWAITNLGPFHEIVYVLIFLAVASGVFSWRRLKELREETRERRRVEDALIEKSNALDAFFENTITPLVLLDRNFNFIRVNNAYAKAGQREVSEFPGHNHFKFYPSEAKAIFENVVTTKEPFQTQAMPFVYSDHPEWGVTYWDWVLTPILDRTGEVAFLVLSLNDVTKRKRAEEKVLQDSIYMRNLIEASLDPLVTISKEGKITDVNKATETVTGVSREQIIGSDFSAYFTEPEKAREGYRQVFTLGFVRDYPLAIRHTSGKITEVLYNASVYKNEAGEVEGIFAAARDITELKDAEEKLKLTIKELTRSNIELDQFAHLAAHDLQEPLRMIACYTQLLEKQYKEKLDAQADEFIAYAVEGAQRMSGMINDLLAYSSLDKYFGPLVPTDCSNVLDRAISGLGEAMANSGARIIREPLPIIEADEKHLTKVFRNLIDNAIKFRGDAIPLIHVGVVGKEHEWVFSVSDNGIGIDPQYFQRIFNIFCRLHPRGKYAGTGIGLAMCKKIVERHGGRIWVESQVGKGSTFYFTIPKKKRR